MGLRARLFSNVFNNSSFTGTITASGGVFDQVVIAAAANQNVQSIKATAANNGFSFPTSTYVGTVIGGSIQGAFTGDGFHLMSNRSLVWGSVAAGAGAPGSSDTAISRLVAGSAGMTVGRWSEKQGAAVASAGEMTLGVDGNRFQITGTTQIDKILITGWQGGSTVTLHFQGSLTVTNATANNGSFHGFRLAGAANFSATANDQLTLQYDSTTAAWFEIARTVI